MKISYFETKNRWVKFFSRYHQNRKAPSRGPVLKRSPDTEEDIPVLLTWGKGRFLIELEPGDLHEDGR